MKGKGFPIVKNAACLVLALSSMGCFAAGDYGDAASFLFGLTENIGEMMQFICLLTGGIMCLGSLVKYSKYRKNPVEVKFSSVLVMLLTGLALIAVGYIPMFAGVR